MDEKLDELSAKTIEAVTINGFNPELRAEVVREALETAYQMGHEVGSECTAYDHY